MPSNFIYHFLPMFAVVSYIYPFFHIHQESECIQLSHQMDLLRLLHGLFLLCFDADPFFSLDLKIHLHYLGSSPFRSPLNVTLSSKF